MMTRRSSDSEQTLRRLAVAIVAVALVASAMSAVALGAPPSPPHRFFGTVSDANGDAVSGATIEVVYQGSVIDTATTNSDGYYDLKVDDPDDSASDETLTLRVAGTDTSKQRTWLSGESSEVNFQLDAGESATTPTSTATESESPTETATPTATESGSSTATPTATATPSSGGSTGGNTGGSSGGSTGSPSGGSTGGGASPGTPAPQPDISVVSATLSDSQITAGDTVTTTATLENTGNASGRTEVALAVNGEPTGESRIIEVSANDRTTVSISSTFTEAGEYSLTFGGEQAGTLRVTASTDTPTPDDSSDDGSDESDGGSDTTTEASDPTPTSTDEPTETGQPGFGVVAALIAVALAVVARARD